MISGVGVSTAKSLTSRLVGVVSSLAKVSKLANSNLLVSSSFLNFSSFFQNNITTTKSINNIAIVANNICGKYS